MAANPYENEREKRCPQCRQYLPRHTFNRNRSSYDGLQPYCRTCEGRYKHEREKGLRAVISGVPGFAQITRWDIDARIASIEARTADDLTRGGSAFTNG